jgi:hypothetical protein
VRIPRYALDDSVDIRIGIILKGAAVRLHARSARRWGSLGSCPKRVSFRHGVRFSMESCPKRVGFRHRSPVFFGVVPERGGFQARGSGFLWGRARKGWVSGTVQTPFCTAVPKCPVRRRIPAEVWKGSVQFCRTSTVIGVIWQKSTEVRKE